MAKKLVDKNLSNSKIIVRIDLKDDDLVHFQSLKEKIAVKNNTSVQNIQNTNVIRDAIRKTNTLYDVYNIYLEKDLANSITKNINSPSFRKKYSIKTIQQFVDTSITNFLNEIDKERKNLRDNLYEILTDLNPFCREIAMILVELDDNSGKITLKNIIENTKREENIILAGLDLLIADGYIESMDYKGEKIYWIP
ncbi:hypothetical protein [Candidatus Lokiarchaeum ossiferum]|uniref:hypothetical protein n=1 Tax=Candidatus Lokiarchaeum ossiferum TaxID=2951803 RepID=UPI00352ECCE6